jgi:hypothetical protein
MKKLLNTLVILFIALNTLHGLEDTWTSSSGSQIQGRYLGSTEGKHWIISQNGRLFKLTDDQLNNESIERITGVEDKRKKRISMGEKISTLVAKDVDSASEQTITELSTLRISDISFESVSVESAVREISDRTDSKIEFKFIDKETRERPVSIRLRNLDADRILEFIVQQASLYYEVTDGIVIIKSKQG